MKHFLAHIDNQDIEFQVEKISATQLKIILQGKTHLLEVQQTGLHQLFVKSQQHSYAVDLYSKGKDWQLYLDSSEVRFSLKDDKDLRREKMLGGAANASGQVVCPMPGKVVDIKVKLGQKVKKGEGLIVVEAMKMQNEFKAQVDGEIKKVFIKVGDSVEEGLVMIVVE